MSDNRSMRSLKEQPEQAGVAHFLEHLTFKGTKAYPSTRALSEAAERSEALTKETRQARESAAAAEARATRLVNAERWWLTAQVLIVLLVAVLPLPG